ncbi:hypothetical protein DY000_02024050 [Brassica cretica]|uniref:Uncharacterized protein n=1 Tax=Brassica cretica TaxID=69181 RepID=A0ABQ7EG02_BRACR|nr:hypothetical protein DY000_02024050 [Brassica cretica]
MSCYLSSIDEIHSASFDSTTPEAIDRHSHVSIDIDISDQKQAEDDLSKPSKQVKPVHNSPGRLEGSSIDNSLVVTIDRLKGVSIDTPLLESMDTFSGPTSNS